MRNGAFGYSNIIVHYCCSWVCLTNRSACGMKWSHFSYRGFACCRHTQEICLFTLKLSNRAQCMLTKKSLCRLSSPHGNSCLGLFSMDDQVLVSDIKTAHPGSLPEYSPSNVRVAWLSFSSAHVLVSVSETARDQANT